jgi:hypothetical protein
MNACTNARPLKGPRAFRARLHTVARTERTRNSCLCAHFVHVGAHQLNKRTSASAFGHRSYSPTGHVATVLASTVMSNLLWLSIYSAHQSLLPYTWRQSRYQALFRKKRRDTLLDVSISVLPDCATLKYLRSPHRFVHMAHILGARRRSHAFWTLLISEHTAGR